MKPPPFLLAAALLLWGWQTGLMAFAMLMGVVLEATRWLDWRVDFNVKDFNRVADLTSLLAVVGGIYCILTREATNQVMLLFQAMSFASQSQAINSVSQATFIYFHWVPMILFPVVAALAYSSHEQYPWSCFFPLARRRAARAGLTQPLTPGINLDYPYFATVLFSACFVNQRNEWFYFALCGLVGFALWATRPRRFHALVWLVTLVLVIKAGYFGHRGLNQLQSLIENKVASWVINWARRGGDHSEATTAIGKIGQLKLSGKIVMQVEPENGPVPQLLRDATFNRFQSPRWSNIVRKSERQVQAIDDGTTWPLLSKPATNTAVISTFSSRRQAVLSTPPGTSTLHDLPVDEVLTNGQGVIRVNNAPDFLRYRTTFGPGESVQSPPILDDAILGAVDLQVPPAELPAVAQIADELGLLALNRPDQVHAIRRFFSSNFKYGSFLPSSLVKVPQGMTPLGFFLLKNRVGHCEYYASATALLLRQAGIPARYAYGWSVQEPDKGVNRFIVRERHAHAWCLYWNSETKTWTDLDTTPSDWVQTENQNASPWEPLADQWSRAWFAFSKWRWYGATGEWQNYLLLALFGLIILLAWRVLARQRRRRIEAGGADMPTVVCPGLDSEFYQIETRLDELGLGRRPGEALSDWLARIEPLAKLSVAPLRQLLVLHYRLRFDPQGLRREERETLRGGVNEWLAQTKPV